MAQLSYLTNQIRLMCINTYDLFTQEEYDVYIEIIKLINLINPIMEKREFKDDEIKQNQLKELLDNKHALQQKLNDLILKHKGIPREVRINGVMKVDAGGVYWSGLRLQKKIAEFVSEESRLIGLKTNEITYDKIIIKWKSLDILEQLVRDGFIMKIQNKDGSIYTKKYIIHTASAGQLLAC